MFSSLELQSLLQMFRRYKVGVILSYLVENIYNHDGKDSFTLSE